MAANNRRENKKSVFDLLNYFYMLIILLLTVYPFYYCLVLAFNEGTDALRGGIYLWPRKFVLDNFSFILGNDLLLTAAKNSLLRTLFGTTLSVALNALVAYGLSKQFLAGRKFYLLLFAVTMYISGGLIPSYIIMGKLGLIDSFLIYILPGAFNFLYTLLLMAYYQAIPDSLVESAEMDGAGNYYIFYKIILPLSLPVIATVALFAGVEQWNNYLDTMIYTKSSSLETLQSIMRKLINEADIYNKMQEEMSKHGVTSSFQAAVSPFTIRVATMIVTTLPIMFLYPFLQRYFVKGIMIGAIKG